eukprot:5957695-Pyramimonas_sp.AAC.1
MEISVCLDNCCVVRPGLPIVGSDAVRLRIEGGLIDLTPLCCDVHYSTALVGPLDVPDVSAVPVS